MSKEKVYVSIKIVKAEPMSYNTYKKKMNTEDKNPREDLDNPGYMITDDKEHKSWMEKNTFEIFYRELTQFECSLLSNNVECHTKKSKTKND